MPLTFVGKADVLGKSEDLQNRERCLYGFALSRKEGTADVYCSSPKM